MAAGLISGPNDENWLRMSPQDAAKALAASGLDPSQYQPDSFHEALIILPQRRMPGTSMGVVLRAAYDGFWHWMGLGRTAPPTAWPNFMVPHHAAHVLTSVRMGRRQGGSCSCGTMRCRHGRGRRLMRRNNHFGAGPATHVYTHVKWLTGRSLWWVAEGTLLVAHMSCCTARHGGWLRFGSVVVHAIRSSSISSHQQTTSRFERI